jgi:Xaa-Pro aminopeptidase
VSAAGGVADVGLDPIALMKAKKNAAELNGSRAAHLRDGAAMVRFLSWLSVEAPKGGVDQITAAARLEAERVATGALKEISFGSISAAGPNAALPHYRPTLSTNRKLGEGIYLIDSGGQYEDGTTDITRTVAIGTPTDGAVWREMRDRYTRVLKGHIAIHRARFPVGASGAQLDTLARVPLWEAGLDFDHGTGHGVGVYLSVHEGPQRISKLSGQVLEAGMILSNEPGYYREGHYGIRIENLVVVQDDKRAGDERAMLGFETLTFCPYDPALIDVGMLTSDERDWVDAYHREVLVKIGPLVAGEALAWLERVTGRL